jgi:hypothetical protein
MTYSQGSLTCEEGGNLSTQDLGFIYVSSEGRVGCEFIHPAKLTVSFLYPGVPAGLTPFRGLVRRNPVPILPPGTHFRFFSVGTKQGNNSNVNL